MAQIQFPNSKGEMLAARFELPPRPPRAFALFAHCFSCSKDIAAASRIARGLTGQGFGVFRFDFTGLGNSDGDFANTNFSSNVQDLLCAADFLRKEHKAPSLLIGHSLGGAAVLVAAGKIPECKAVCTIGAPSDPGHVSHLFEKSIDEIESHGEANVDIAGRKFTIKKQFLDDIAGQNLQTSVKELKRALLLFHSPVDNTVGIEHAKNIYTWAKHPKSFVSLDHADHLLRKSADSEYVSTTLAAWASRYLPSLPEMTVEDSNSAIAEGEVHVEERDAKLAQTIRMGPHGIVADEPASLGGTNTGPTPYDLLLAGLGACTSMTIRMAARRRKWPLEKVFVRLKHSKIHAQDCEECETQVGKVDQIEREIILRGPIDPEQRQSLLAVAEKCPVHRTLHSEVIVKSRLADS